MPSINCLDIAIENKHQSHALVHEKLQYWIKQLADSHPVEFFCDKPRPVVLSGESSEEDVIVDGTIYENLQAFCKEYEVTPFVVLLASFRATHYRLTGSEDATIGVPIANQNQQEQEDGVSLINLHCIRIKIRDESFEELVRQVQATDAAAFANQDVPFEKIVAELQLNGGDASRNPIVQTTFAIHSQCESGRLMEDVNIKPTALPNTKRFDLEFVLFQEEQKFRGSVLFSTELFEPRSIDSMISIFYEVLRQGLKEPRTPIALLPLADGPGVLREIGLMQIEDSSVVDASPKKAAGCSTTVAAKDAFSHMMYAELDQQSDVPSSEIPLKDVEVVPIAETLSEQVGTEQALHQSAGVQDQDFNYFRKEQRAIDEEAEVEGWKALYDALTYAEINSIDNNALGQDFMGWTSMYDGSEVNKDEMTEWLNDTIRAICNGSAPSHVLEIGTGTGMILFNLIKGLKSYTGLEPVNKAVDFVAKMVGSIPDLAGKVEIHVGTAADVTSLIGSNLPETVVVNSVVQYFPSLKYLMKLVEDLLQIQSAKYLFFGDIRSYALYREFLMTSALHHAEDAGSRDKVRQRMQKLEKSEMELLVDPAFFTGLQYRFPHLVEHVEILPKRMKASNELSCYRYAAVVHKKHQEEQPLQIHTVGEGEWIDFMEHRLDRNSLLDLLQSSTEASIVAISNIPHSKTILERCALDSLDRRYDESQANDEWLPSLCVTASYFPSLSADELKQLADQTGFQLEVSWARQSSQRGGLDAVFHHIKPRKEGERVLFRFPVDYRDRPLHSTTNQPHAKNLNLLWF
jgi:condensation domain-containing protein